MGYSLDTKSSVNTGPNVYGSPVTSGNVTVGGNPNLALLTSTASTIVSNPLTLAIVAAAAVVGFLLWRKYK